MRTVSDLKSEFHVYFDEMDRCKLGTCHWALIHLLLAIPDICASLQRPPNSQPDRKVGSRYLDWCDAHMPKHPLVTSGDRYQMRNVVLHLGSSTTEPARRKTSGKGPPKGQTQYDHFSFLTPGVIDKNVHHTTDAGGCILNIHPLALAAETEQAMLDWFARLQRRPDLMSNVEANLHLLVKEQNKSVPDMKGGVTTMTTYNLGTTSST